MKVIAVVQARMGSTRLPGKVLKEMCSTPMIELLLRRLSGAKELDQIVVATTNDESDSVLANYVQSLGYVCERGSVSDVLDRYLVTAKKYSADVVVRITGDCPLVDPCLVDHLVSSFRNSKLDYLCNNYPPTLPDGLDVEVFTYDALESAWSNAVEKSDREHVTPYIRNSGNFKTAVISNAENLSDLRWTVDEPADFSVVNKVFDYFFPKIDFSWEDVLTLYRKNPEIFNENSKIIRNEGAILGTGQKLWKRAKQVIPGGNMLLSKRSEMFLPDLWPSYFSKAKGCRVWDMDGNEFIDMSIMGIGTNTLGYGYPDVDAAVIKTVGDGNMSSLNCPEEVYLAEKLIELHPWADMVRFARSGGEANAIAIRIARAASGKDNVAICGYHGWHDWYLSANLADDENLNGHLLPGLEPRGVPRNLKGTVFPFRYNNYLELENLVNSENIGVIKMEVSRNEGPKDDFLAKVRKLATDRGIVLIFDECTSGFRETFGGLHKKYGVEPDMAVFAKALGNGYSITATIGKKSIMESAQTTFISSTFWTERIGPSAALATLKVMERLKSWEIITETGNSIKTQWERLANKYQLEIDVWGLPALAGFTFKSPNALAYKTLITQEMLNKGYLASNTLYSCIEHTPKIVEDYLSNLEPIFGLIKQCEEGLDVTSLLKTSICHSGFKRLN